MKGHFTMRKREALRVRVLEEHRAKQITQSQGADQLGLSVRQFRRIYKRYLREGLEGLVHKSRGRESNNRVNPREVERALELVRTQYYDCGPTLVHEKLVVRGFKLSVESLRRVMIREGLWKAKKRKRKKVRPLRERRACFGELVQVDGSPYRWLGTDQGMLSLLVFIDDATSSILRLKLVKSESTMSYFRATKQYLESYGKPLAFYLDRHSVFRVNNAGGRDSVGSSSSTDSHGLTEFGRACDQLGIDLIYANTPQAKGRVERSNQTLQGRLPQELRLKGITSIGGANKYLEQYRLIYNKKFAREPRKKHNLHRRLAQADNLEKILTVQESRVLSRNLTCQYKNIIYQIKTKRPRYALSRAKVIITLDSQDRVVIWYKGEKLSYITAKKRLNSKIVGSKQLNPEMDKIKKKHQESLVTRCRPTKTPWETPTNEMTDIKYI